VVRVPPPLIALVAALAQRVVAGRSPTPTRSRAAVASAVSLASATLAGSAGRQFQRRGTTIEPFHPERASVLVTTGSNAVSRNPMYVGLAGVLAAHAIWRRSWAALVPVAAFVLLIDRTQVQAEEAALHERFGSAYDAYRAATPRWLDHRSLGLPKH
jgi:protein-S-isoprenylcysteine O-methyltransferase Ste14